MSKKEGYSLGSGGLTPSENLNEADVLSHADEHEHSTLEFGTVGHEDDSNIYFDQGSSGNDGHTLVKVQLFRGRDRERPIRHDVAQGHKIVAQIGGGLFRIPPKGTRVLVAMPSGMQHVPGAPVILHTVEPSPSIQFSGTRAKLDYGANTDFVVKAKSIILSDYSNRFLYIGPNGIICQDTDGSGFTVQNGVLTLLTTDGATPPDTKAFMSMSQTQIVMSNKLGSYLTMTADFTTGGNHNFVLGGAVLIGSPLTLTTTPVNACLHGTTGVTGVASTSVFIAV